MQERDILQDANNQMNEVSARKLQVSLFYYVEWNAIEVSLSRYCSSLLPTAGELEVCKLLWYSVHFIMVVKIRTKEDITRNQCEFSLTISKLPGARENGSDKVAIGFSFKSDWLKKWHEVPEAREMFVT